MILTLNNKKLLFLTFLFILTLNHNQIYGQNINIDSLDLLKSPCTLLLFTKSNCPYCKMQRSFFDSLTIDYVIVDINKYEKWSNIFQISATPTLLIISNGLAIKKYVGLCKNKCWQDLLNETCIENKNQKINKMSNQKN